MNLNQRFLNNVFATDTANMHLRVGDAMWLAKQSANDYQYQRYILFTDPAIHILIPKGSATVDYIAGKSTASTVRVKSLSVDSISGTWQNVDGSFASSTNGTALLQLFDSEDTVTIASWGINYLKSGSLLYRGEVSVINGRYTAEVPIPKDVTFGGNARLSLYAWNSNIDAAGSTSNIKISGVDSTVAVDTAGPAISIYLGTRQFQSGDIVTTSPKLLVDLSDSSGINTSMAGVGHQLTGTLTNPTTTYSLSSYYQSNLDTYKSGTITYPLSNISDGQHTITVKAYDLQNNVSSAEVVFVAHDSSDVGMYCVYNYPNPFSSSTYFTFQRNSSTSIDVEVRIYSVAGRLIQVLDSRSLTDRYVKVLWDGRDRDGNKIANGVYLYKVITKTFDGKSSEVLGKLAIVR
jgi:hypothetical protein